MEKGAPQVLMLIASRRQLLDLPDEMATKVNIVFYGNPADAFVKAVLERKPVRQGLRGATKKAEGYSQSNEEPLS